MGKVKNHRKTYITNEIMEYINQIRYNKRKYRSIWRTVRNLKRKYHRNVEKNGKPIPTRTIRSKLDNKQYSIWKQMIQQDKIRDNMIRKARRKFIKQKTESTINRGRNKPWYQTAKQIGELYNNQRSRMQRLIHPHIAIKKISKDKKKN